MQSLAAIAATPIGPLPLFAWFGVAIVALLFWQAATGLRLIKIDFKIHKATGLTAVALTMIHVPLALIYLGVLK
jgi:hypothetical protein